jgi:hypothetical protein
VADPLDAILAATNQVPGDRWAMAKQALAEAIRGEPEAFCGAVLDDQAGVCVRVGETLCFVRFDERGVAITYLGSLRGGSLTETTQSRQGMMESEEFDLRFRYDQLGRHLTIQTSQSQLEEVGPIRDLLRQWSSDPS